MQCTRFFGTPFFPNKPFSNRNFCRVVKVALGIILFSGLILLSLQGKFPMGLPVKIGLALIPTALIGMVAYGTLTPNYLERAFLKALEDNDRDRFKAIQATCFPYVFWGPRSSSNLYSCVLQGHLDNINWDNQVKQYIINNKINFSENEKRQWDQTFTECDNDIGEDYTFEHPRFFY